MAKYTVSLSHRAERQLDKLSEKLAHPIITAIAKLAANPRPNGCKKLKGREGYRIRVGDYRIIYTIGDFMLVIVVIDLGHRKDVYR